MVRRLTRFVIAAVALPSPASASDWVKVGESDEVVHYFDKSSVATAGPFYQAWSRVQYSSGKWKETRGLDYYDCAQKRSATKALVTYNRDGSNHSFTLEDSELEWHAIVPDTMEEGAFQLICN